jgi:protochlorophyllide reductase
MARFTMIFNSVFLLLCLGVLDGTAAFQNSKLRTSPVNVLSATTGGDRTRRDLLFEAGGIALSSLVLGQTLPAFAQGGDFVPQTIVVTGANSGIGFDACKRLAQQGHNLVLACRTMDKSVATAFRLKDLGGTMITAECDLASLVSIKAFADKLPSLIDNKKIDCLCLNAGLARNTASKDVARTADGFELTVGTNYFGHFHLNQLLLPSINPSGGRIVSTASGVHDPESPGGQQGEKATLGDVKGLEQDGRSCEMLDGGAFSADKAYKDSKVCTTIFAS